MKSKAPTEALRVQTPWADDTTQLSRVCFGRRYKPYEAMRAAAIKHRLGRHSQSTLPDHSSPSTCPSPAEELRPPAAVEAPSAERWCAREERCTMCGGPMLIAHDASYLQCNACHVRRVNMDPTIAAFTFGGEPDFAFGNGAGVGKTHHFGEALKNIQCKGGKRVEDKVIREVMLHITAVQGLNDACKIQRHHVHTALKDKGLRGYYTLEPQIFCRITGEPPPFFEDAQEQVLWAMFNAIQAPYQRAKALLGCERKTFFPYGYCIFKFLQILGWSKYMRVFGLLKQKKKLLAHEELFEVICNDKDLNWEFVSLPAEFLY